MPLETMGKPRDMQAFRRERSGGSQPDTEGRQELTVSSPSDAAEREAEAVAHRITDGTGETASVDRVQTDREKEAETRIPAETERTVRQAIESGGKSLPPDLQTDFGPKLGTDLSDVSIHTGTSANTAARSINAEAFTLGSDIAFADGAYRPDTRSGRRLLAHELTHVAQHSGGVDRSVHRQSGLMQEQSRSNPLVEYYTADIYLDEDLEPPGEYEDASLEEIKEQIAVRRARLRRGGVDNEVTLWAEMRELIKFVAIRGRHSELRNEPWLQDPETQAALDEADAAVQSVNDEEAAGDYTYDHYSIIVSSMPPEEQVEHEPRQMGGPSATTGGTGSMSPTWPTESNLPGGGTVPPERFLQEWKDEFHSVIDDVWFRAINEFEREDQSGSPELGDIVRIEIAGPDNGDVMLVDSSDTHFVFQTITTNEHGRHPEHGAREFGFEREPTGGIRFYTKGVSRPNSVVVGLGGTVPQTEGWRGLIRGLATEIENRGGSVIWDSYTEWQAVAPA